MDASQKPDVLLVEPNRKKPTQEEKSTEASLRPSVAEQYCTASERRAEGKALRDDVQREAHGGWKPPKDLCNSIEILLEMGSGQSAGSCSDLPRADAAVAVHL